MARTVDLCAVYDAKQAYFEKEGESVSIRGMMAAIAAADEHRAPAIKEAMVLFMDALEGTLKITAFELMQDENAALSKQEEALRRFNDLLRLLGIEPEGNN